MGMKMKMKASQGWRPNAQPRPMSLEPPKTKPEFDLWLDLFFGIEKASDYAILLGRITWERERNGRE